MERQTRQRQAIGAHRARGEPRVTQTAQTQTDHQNHRQPQRADEVGLLQAAIQRRGPAADAFDHHRVGLEQRP